MDYFNIWNILGIISILLLFFFGKGKSAVWGGLTLGIIVGIILAVVYLIRGEDFQWIILKKSVIIGTLAGLIAELLGKVARKKN